MLELDPSEIEELQRYADEVKQMQMKQMQFQGNMELAKATKPDSNLLMAMSDLVNNPTNPSKQNQTK